MNIEFVGRNYHLAERVRAFTQDKLQKLTKFVDEPVEVHVTLEVEKHRQIAEMHLSHRHGVLQAREETEQMLDTINLVVDKLEKQARRSHKKFVQKKRRAQRNNHESEDWSLSVVEQTSVGKGTAPRVVKSSMLQIKPMTIDEAALQLESSEDEFVVFRDSGSDQINVLYKRKDRNYGLISPDD